MATNHSSKRPATTLRCGNIKATIWQNVSEKGPFFATTFSRPFKDQSGAWRNGTSFGLNDLEALMNVAFEAKKWITARTKPLQREASGPLGASFTATRWCEPGYWRAVEWHGGDTVASHPGTSFPVPESCRSR